MTSGPVVVFPTSGTGAWEAALLNTLSPGDKVLMFETGHFATLWCNMAKKFGLEVDFVPTDWRHGVDPQIVEDKLKADSGHQIKSVNIVHNETSTGVLSRVAEVRQAIDNAGHPALFMVDTGTGVVSMVARDFESPADDDTNNVYQVTLEAVDDDGNPDLVVANYDANTVSVLKGIGEPPLEFGTPLEAFEKALADDDAVVINEGHRHRANDVEGPLATAHDLGAEGLPGRSGIGCSPNPARSGEEFPGQIATHGQRGRERVRIATGGR